MENEGQPSGGTPSPQPPQSPPQQPPQPQPAPQPAPVKPVSFSKKKGRKGIYLGILIILIAGVGSFLYFSGSLGGSPVTGAFVSGEKIASGDKVSVLYAGRLPNGKLFDTNIESVAKKEGFNRTVFPALEFVVGSGQMIQGFDEAVVGMRKGETKKITIPPEKAYGLPDPTRVISSPRETKFNRTESIPLVNQVPAEQFIQFFGPRQNGEEFIDPNTKFTYRVLNTTNGIVSFKIVLEQGKTYRFPGAAWNTTVLRIEGDKAMVRNSPGETDIQTEFGVTTLRYEIDHIILKVNPTVGTKINSLFGTVTITAVDEKNFTVDLNHELAGKTLTFDIEIVNVTKGAAQTTLPAQQTPAPAGG